MTKKKCDFCGRKLNKNKITYIEGRPYCEDCVSEAEIHSDVQDGDDDDDDDEVYGDDDDDDNDDD